MVNMGITWGQSAPPYHNDRLRGGQPGQLGVTLFLGVAAQVDIVSKF